MSNITFNTRLIHIRNSYRTPGNITVTAASNFTLEQEIFEGGSTREKNIFKISGTTVKNKQTVIATVKIQVSDSTNKMFKKTPYISRNSKFNLQLSSIERNGASDGVTIGVINAYNFNLIYKSNKSSQVSDAANESVRIYFEEVDVVRKYNRNVKKLNSGGAVINNIHNLAFNLNALSIYGEDRKISVSGLPGSNFLLNILNEENQSIIDASIANFDYEISNGNTIRTLKGTIPKSGVYSFKQKFPSSIVHAQTTTTNSGASQFIINDISTIKIGDTVYSEFPTTKQPEINAPSGTTNNLTPMVVSSINPDLDNPNEITVTGKTLTNSTANVPISFIRPRSYKISCIPTLDQPKNFGVLNKEFTLSQPLDPIITFKIQAAADTTISRVFLSDNLAGLSSVGSTSTLFSAGDDLEIKSLVKNNYNTYDTSLAVEKIYVKMVINLASNYATTTNPTISNFSNTNPRNNGGTRIALKHSLWSGISGANGALTLGLCIDRYGNSDVTITLNLDDILTHV